MPAYGEGKFRHVGNGVLMTGSEQNIGLDLANVRNSSDGDENCI